MIKVLMLSALGKKRRLVLIDSGQEPQEAA